MCGRERGYLCEEVLFGIGPMGLGLASSLTVSVSVSESVSPTY